MKAPKVVFFDMDNTLVDHQYASENALLHVRNSFEKTKKYDMALIKSGWRRDFNRYWKDVIRGKITLEESWIQRFKQMFQSLGIDSLSNLPQKAAYEYGRIYATNVKEVPGALDLIRVLKGEGISIGVITNNTERMQSTKLRDCGFAEYVDFVLTSESCGIMKPDPRIFQMALEKFNVIPAESVMVGDSYEYDIVGALESGISSVWFNRNGELQSGNGSNVPILRSFYPTNEAFDAIVNSLS